ncbi:MAG: HAMP domain-containing sensor histidine kinase [Terriglobia bacterium]
MAELLQAGKVHTLSGGSLAKSVKKAEGSVARRADQPSGASTAPRSAETATPLPALYQDLLEARGHLEEELHSRTLALATLAHEIKNPLAIVSGYVEMLLSREVGPLTERQRNILEQVRSNCARLQKFAQEFLAFSSLTKGNAAVMLRLQPGDLSACVSEVCGYWIDKFSAKGVALYFRANAEIPLFKFDYHKIQQVVSNLLENALKFTPSGGAVWLASELHVWERRGRTNTPHEVERRRGGSAGANAVRVTVADSGKGIAPEFHQEVFEDFFRVPGDEIQTQGAGLGLAIARRLVQLHEGKIWVESELGVGSRICFLLPLRQT